MSPEDEPTWLSVAYVAVGLTFALCAVGILFWYAFLR
jgi:hypothetical protein